MRRGLVVQSRLARRMVNLPLFRRIVQVLLREFLCCQPVGLGIYLVDAKEITRLNETFLQHRGETDVITFDYADRGKSGSLSGEVFVCLPVAQRQARRFQATWQSEMVRYTVHGLLHLSGYDDKRARDRIRMKRQENRLLRDLSGLFTFRRLARSGRRGSGRPGPRSSRPSRKSALK